MKKTFISLLVIGSILATATLVAPLVHAADCGGVKTSLINCTSSSADSISGMLLKIIDFMAIGVGIAVVAGIAWGGLIYAQSGGDAGKVKEAKQIIINAIIGLVLFFLMYAATNFLVPGGLFR